MTILTAMKEMNTTLSQTELISYFKSKIRLAKKISKATL